MYVVKRNGVYQFRKPIPNSLQPLFGRGDVRVSLRTTQASVAHRRALEMLVHVDDIFAMLRSERPVDETRRLVVSMLEHAGRMVQGTLWVTGALAQDAGLQPGPGNLDDGGFIVPNERRVHIEGVCIVKNKKTNEDEEQHFVLYPQAIERLKGPIEVGATGKIHRKLVDLSGMENMRWLDKTIRQTARYFERYRGQSFWGGIWKPQSQTEMVSYTREINRDHRARELSEQESNQGSYPAVARGTRAPSAPTARQGPCPVEPVSKR